MSATLTISEVTRRAQSDASDPSASVFVAANAGSGKTFVLARRVVRLLVGGAEPSRILCLTYTKAAAAEMQGRIFSILQSFIAAPDGELSATIADLGGERPGESELRRARRLFATALETPGGLKVQTIHAFCEQILHLFPLEAHVPGHFEVMDEQASTLLLAEARRRLILSAVDGAERDPQLAESFAEALSLGGEWGLDGLVDEVVARRDAIEAHLRAAGGVEGAVELLAGALGLRESDTEDELFAAAADPRGLDPAFRQQLALAAEASPKPTDAKLAGQLREFERLADGPARFLVLREMLFRRDGEPRKARSLATKLVHDSLPELEDRLEEAACFVEELDARLRTLRLFRASRAALVIAERLAARYAALKRSRARLDFEDLITRTADLLSRREASAWVHYKLDQGIDHVLVDEAQDTSPRQWQVVRSLVEEFFAGESERARTVFAVGDEKQSIYSFQGASPLMFTEERRALKQRADAVEAPFRHVALHQSFRSAPPVLEAVDFAFEGEQERSSLSADGVPPTHASARVAAPGLVELWPVLVKDTKAAADDWLAPIDEEPRASPLVRLADRIAATVESWLGRPIEHRGTLRPLAPGDVVVLVRKRSAFSGAMTAAFRDRRIPVAGADRLLLTEHIAVEDLLALARTVANSEDELSLAAILKSPFFAFTDDDLMALALSRRAEGEPEPLFLALRRLAAEDGAALVPDWYTDPAALHRKAMAAFARLEELRRRAGFQGVFEFFARILGPEGGRAALAGRLGRDSGEVVDAFLSLALAFETEGGADLDAFVSTLETNPPVVKREMGEAHGEVRVMTVHAAKGLEAPVVFLVDPGSAPFSATHGARLIRWEGMPGLPPEAPPGFLWCPDKALAAPVVVELREGERRRAEDEYLRLLYVGMTRAADRLVVCGHAGTRGADPRSWLQRLTATLGSRFEEVTDASGETVALRWGSAAELLAERMEEAPGDAAEPEASRIDLAPLAREPAPPRPLVPSDPAGTLRIDAASEHAGGSPIPQSGTDSSPALRRGRLVHRLLQVLPEIAQTERDEAARRFLDTQDEMGAAERDELRRSTLAILADPRFAAVFAPGSRAEIAVRGEVRIADRLFPVSGTVDRIAVSKHEVLVVDHKTNRPAPASMAEVPRSYVQQLALYRALLSSIYPDRPVRAAILFTEAPRLMEIDAAALDGTLAELAAVRSPAA